MSNPGQSNAAAERSAHVTRGGAQGVEDSFIVEVSPGRYALKAVVRRDREIAELQARVAELEAQLASHK